MLRVVDVKANTVRTLTDPVGRYSDQSQPEWLDGRHLLLRTDAPAVLDVTNMKLYTPVKSSDPIGLSFSEDHQWAVGQMENDSGVQGLYLGKVLGLQR